MARAPVAQEIEAPPEADRLGDFPHPRERRELIGQEAAERTLAQAFAGGRMHHAWLLAGRCGVGKATLAYRLARHVLAKPGESFTTTGVLPSFPATFTTSSTVSSEVSTPLTISIAPMRGTGLKKWVPTT